MQQKFGKECHTIVDSAVFSNYRIFRLCFIHFCYPDRGTKSHHKATFCQRQFMFLMHFSRLCPFVSNLLTQPDETLRFEIDKAFLAWDAARLRQSDALWIWKPCSSGAKWSMHFLRIFLTRPDASIDYLIRIHSLNSCALTRGQSCGRGISVFSSDVPEALKGNLCHWPKIMQGS